MISSDQLENLDLSIQDNEMLDILKDMRHRWTLDYNRLKIGKRLNELVENSQVVEQQNEQLKRLIIQIAQLDSDVKELEGRISSQHG